ncbi:MAG: serine hydrolase domain-containing protein [Bacteroidota bacterium]
MKFAPISLLIVLLLAACNSSTPTNETPISEELTFDSLTLALDQLAAQEKVAGFGVAIVGAAGAIYQQGFGYADIANKTPYTPQHLQNIGSVSKTFIGVSLQQAVEQGLLQWDSPINDFLPFEVIHPLFPDQPILLSHLATHTAGINDGDDYDLAYSLTHGNSYQGEDLDEDGVEEFARYAQNQAYALGDFCQAFLAKDGSFYQDDHFLETAPGEVYEYSNVGAALAAHVLEQVSGISFPEWTQRHIQTPLGMENSGWSFDEVDMAKHANLYYGRTQPLPHYTLATYPDGGFITSVEDLSIYLSAMIAGYGQPTNPLTNTGGLENIMQVRASGDGEQYGYFWETQDSGAIGHSGGDPGIITLMFFQPEIAHGFIVFFNGHPTDDGQVIGEVIDLIVAEVRKVAG